MIRRAGHKACLPLPWRMVMYDLPHQLMTPNCSDWAGRGRGEGLASSRRSSDLGVLGDLIGAENMTGPRDKLGRPVVVVTGMGIVTSLGAGKTDNWAKLTVGESGIRTITRFPIDGLKTTIAGTVDFVAVEPRSSTGLTERLAEMVAEEALEQSRIGTKGDFPGPLFLAVAPVEFEWSQRFDLGRATGKLDPNYDDLLRISGGGKFAPYHRRFTFGSVAAHLAETFGTKGSPISLSTACASGATAIQLGVEAIRRGGVTDSVHRTRSSPDAKPIIGCVLKTLADAGMTPEHIDHINAHGTATPENDKMEYLGISTVFGELAQQIPVSSNKSMVGHTISAAGAVEAVFSLLTLEHQRIPPTINYDIPDPTIPFDVVGNKARDAKVTAVLSNSFGFGGQNASLVLTREPA